MFSKTGMSVATYLNPFLGVTTTKTQKKTKPLLMIASLVEWIFYLVLIESKIKMFYFLFGIKIESKIKNIPLNTLLMRGLENTHDRC